MKVTVPCSPLLIGKLFYFIYLFILTSHLYLSGAYVFPKHISKETPHGQKLDISSKVSGYVSDRGGLSLVTNRILNEMVVPRGKEAEIDWTAIQENTFSYLKGIKSVSPPLQRQRGETI